jgi:transmembrane sensor
LNYAESANISTANLINRLEIPRGGEFKIKLADGTEVWLNAETELRYPTVFSSLERRVKLQGEGYFKVAKNEKQPFIVEVGDIEVKVYGTQFNISTQNKDNIETVLVSGSVSIRHHDQETHLNPSQKAAYTSSGKLTIEEVDVLPYITWKDGNFMFQNESLESVMNKLARWYDLDVFYLNEQTKNLSGMMTRYKEVSELFHYFEKISTARFIIKGRTVTVK